MERIGIRELRQHASRWVRRVQLGESFEVTDRGRPVAVLGPPPTKGVVERLTAQGRLSSPAGDLAGIGPPLEPKENAPLPSELLELARANER